MSNVDVYKRQVVACKKNFGAASNIKVTIDRETGKVSVFAQKTIVDEVYDPAIEISLEDARKISPLYSLGDVCDCLLYTSTFEGKPIKLNDPQASMSAGLSFVSEDRRGVGLLLGMSIEENMVVPYIYNFKKYLKKVLSFTQKDTKDIRENALKYIDMLDIRCTGPTQPVMRLSGGNQQKVCIARALTLEPVSYTHLFRIYNPFSFLHNSFL